MSYSRGRKSSVESAGAFFKCKIKNKTKFLTQTENWRKLKSSVFDREIPRQFHDSGATVTLGEDRHIIFHKSLPLKIKLRHGYKESQIT